KGKPREQRVELLALEIVKAGGISAYAVSHGIKPSTIRQYLSRHKKWRDWIGLNTFPAWFPGKPGDPRERRVKRLVRAISRMGSISAWEGSRRLNSRTVVS